eukprot:CAMPEP_0174921534 /NCGR_PEP_ID=MMETSP1355-20121228/5207_1 /TAXON_ID=464990 /ORGANISM="Hemiselmis tepida, Strain CCMP443" /LENGTH=70 /DNA_ID=CAMNT_0016167017 /DNA_START=33 /DNA_END=242 /DNA_ORIENTATION=+
MVVDEVTGETRRSDAQGATARLMGGPPAGMGGMGGMGGGMPPGMDLPMMGMGEPGMMGMPGLPDLPGGGG